MTARNAKLTGTPEVDGSGVYPKSGRKAAAAAKKSTVNVTHKTERRGRHWLRNFVAGTLVADLTFGEVFIYSAGMPPDVTIHAMWAFGIAHTAALAAILFHKLE